MVWKFILLSLRQMISTSSYSSFQCPISWVSTKKHWFIKKTRGVIGFGQPSISCFQEGRPLVRGTRDGSETKAAKVSAAKIWCLEWKEIWKPRKNHRNDLIQGGEITISTAWNILKHLDLWGIVDIMCDLSEAANGLRFAPHVQVHRMNFQLWCASPLSPTIDLLPERWEFSSILKWHDLYHIVNIVT